MCHVRYTRPAAPIHITSNSKTHGRQRKMIFLNIEGNIGVGKSTVIDLLQAHYRQQDKDVVRVVPEPIDDWRRPIPDTQQTPLSLLYDDPKENGFAFQMFATHTRMQRLVEAIRDKPHAVIMERSCVTRRDVFGSYIKKTLSAMEWHTYQSARALARNLADAMYPDRTNVTVYLRSDPQECLRRMQQRGRVEECEHVGLDYLRKIHELHEWFFFDIDSQKGHAPVHIVDGNAAPEEVCGAVIAILDKLLQAR